MNIQELMKQAKKMQKELSKKQDDLKEKEFTFSKQGIDIVMYGDRQIKSLTINPVLIDPEDKETLEDLIIITINEALKELDKKHDELLPKGV
ncbi:YbaB/EbfC family nucleoid-associated protein [Mesomycoplasma neurolyticum]|uniref:Nucleoid-associated protein NCTC10166_00348 n=1 Tax=Mesomycoplasma neurolyticum TaxID=2120 RepID=A0A449A507_9BACT|nr:YbaB/EbfC family nucleoid-associated protein [Mesomycoplasma neurolyticum]VEU59380.1 putative DNA repair-related protein [Mesomycoplasma neurolyticum]